MHGRLYNQLDLEIAVIPQTPLLIKSGQKASIDPALPDMQFVRTRRRARDGDIDEVVYIPGSSLRGVVRAHAERLLRTLDEKHACYVEATKSCLRKRQIRENEATAQEIYAKSCYACKLFGNTGIASRVQLSDLYPAIAPLSETRFGVAIDRITGAVAVGPFDLEVVTDARFEGRIVLRNFTIGQLGLLGAALLDIADGLVALGHAKSRGLGRVRIEFVRAQFRFAQEAHGAILGVGALAEKAVRKAYNIPEEDRLQVEGFHAVRRDTVYHQADSDSDAQIREWLSAAAPCWVEEAKHGG